MTPIDRVIFRKGETTYRGEGGTVRLIAPRDVTAGDLSAPLARLILAADTRKQTS